jgi:glycosyltransferase involved in cell wall biosynthesis
MKILHIITRIDKGGSAQNTLLTVRGLSQLPQGMRNKYKVTLITGSVKKTDVSNINLTILPKLNKDISPMGDIICLLQLYKFIKGGNFNIVHTHSSKAGFIGRIAAKLAGAPIIIHTPHGHIFYEYFNPYITRIFILLERFVAKFTDRIISLTENETLDYLKFNIAPKEKFITIHSGIEIEKFSNVPVNKKEKLKKMGIIDSPVVISVARLVPIKGHQYLIDAAARVVRTVPAVKFIFAGDGPMRENLEKQARFLGIKNNILFLGERSDIPELLKCADIFAISSLNEGMGRAIVEAMAAGLPVVGTNVCGISNIVENGVTGILVNSRDIKAFADAIIKLIAEEKLREKMGENGRKVASRYGVKQMIEKIASLYEKCLTSR